MLKEKDRILDELSQLFLSYRDLDEAYFKTIRTIKRLNNGGIDIGMEEIQEKAYGCGEVE